MKLTVITATCDRPAAFRLCEAMLARQTRQPDQWLILDDGETPIALAEPLRWAGIAEIHRWPELRGSTSMAMKVLRAVQTGLIAGDAIAFVEDDDHYKATWLAWCAAKLAEGYDLVGEGCAAYYNVRRRWSSNCLNVRHAALCQTALSRDLLEPLANVIQAYESPFFDGRLWAVDCPKFLTLPRTPAERLVVGIKGIRSGAGATGYSGEHRSICPPAAKADPSLLTLWNWIGDDAENYLSFHHSTPDPAKP